jgi:carboxypeptidase Taq
MSDELKRLMEKVHLIHDLNEAQQALEWDQQVMMPRLGAEQRSRELGALATVAHFALVDPELGELIQSLHDSETLGADARADLREAKRARDRAIKLPASLVAERARTCSLAQVAWESARERSDFPAFVPHLRRVFEISREVAAAIGTENPYDALLDEYEPGTSEAELRPIFADLRERLVPILDRIQGAPRQASQAVLKRAYPLPQQEAFGRRVAVDMGYDLEAGRLDRSAHPFTSGPLGDVRITTRYDERFLSTSLFGIIHEAGHAIYEQGLDPARYRDPSGQACSLGIHESQSRFWENLIGRSLPFWTHYYPLLRQTFPGVLDDTPLHEFYRAINVCAPSLIRVEADEITYNLHIILRFELESALLHGDLDVADLPAAWSTKMQALLGIKPGTDREGVLQDVHWSAGLIGYFPTYALGNLYAAQLMSQLRRDLPDLETLIGAGRLRPIKQWLNQAIHVHGRRHLAPELCRRVTGRAPAADDLIDYLKNKYYDIYSC